MGGKPLLLLSHTGAKQYSRMSFGGPRGGTPPTGVVVVTGEPAENPKSPNGKWAPEQDTPNTVIFRTCAQDSSAMYTVSHACAMTAVALIAEAAKPGCMGGDAALRALPGAMQAAVDKEPEVEALAKAWHANSAGGGEIVCLGAGPHEPSATEVEIKVGEASRVRCKGYPVENYLHGRQIQLQPTDAFMIFGGPGAGLERTQAAARFLAAVQANCGGQVSPAVVWVGPPGSCPVADKELGGGIQHIEVAAGVPEQLAVIVEAVPGQMLAGHMAALCGVDGDSFRMDKATTDAQSFMKAHVGLISKL